MPGRKAPEERREQILRAALRVAMRNRLSGLTIRDIAREARLSSGLVLFHFKTRDRLISALLSWLLERTSVLRPPAIERVEGSALDCLVALIRAEAARMASDRVRSELFFEYWVLGTRMKGLRRQMRRGLARYRHEFRTLAAKVLSSAHGQPGSQTEWVADAAVSFVYGCAIQAVIDPERFNVKAPLKILDLIADLGHEGRKPLRSASAAHRRKRDTRSAGRRRREPGRNVDEYAAAAMRFAP